MGERDVLSRDNPGWLLAKASQRWNELLAARFVASGYPEVRPAFGSVLVPLYEQDGLRMGELARRSGLSKQAMTTLVRSVEAAGLVVRERDPSDARAVRISLTERGQAFQPEGRAALRELDDLLRRRLSPAELELLTRVLQEVVQL